MWNGILTRGHTKVKNLNQGAFACRRLARYQIKTFLQLYSMNIILLVK